jgi:hypothetical protein
MTQPFTIATPAGSNFHMAKPRAGGAVAQTKHFCNAGCFCQPVVQFCRTTKNAFQLSHRSWNKPGLASGRSPDLRVNEAEYLPRGNPPVAGTTSELSSQRLQLRGSGGFSPRFPTPDNPIYSAQRTCVNVQCVRSEAKKVPPSPKRKAEISNVTSGGAFGITLKAGLSVTI